MAVDEMVSDQFPAGLRVLAVDYSNSVLETIKEMCMRFNYRVTTCNDATHALNLLRQGKKFDLILLGAYMPNMDGYEFLQCLNQEQINVPVITMSSDGSPSAVSKAFQLGAVDYWTEFHENAFKNMWKHALRKRGSDDSHVEATSADATRVVNEEQNRSNATEAENDESDNCDQDHPPSKKRCLVWTPELHENFVRAVNLLGLHNAGSTEIHSLMNEPGVTIENVSSHLQKYKEYLKKYEVEIPQQHNVMCPHHCHPEQVTVACAAQPLAQYPPNIANNFPQSVGDTSTRQRNNSQQQESLIYQQFCSISTPCNMYPLSIGFDRGYPDFEFGLFPQDQPNNSLGTAQFLGERNIARGRGNFQGNATPASSSLQPPNPSLPSGSIPMRPFPTPVPSAQSNNSLGVAQFQEFVCPAYISQLLQNSGLPSGSVARRPFPTPVPDTQGIPSRSVPMRRPFPTPVPDTQGIPPGSIPMRRSFPTPVPDTQGIPSRSIPMRRPFPTPVPETQVTPSGSRSGDSIYQESPKILGCDGNDTCIPSKSAGPETISFL